MSLSGLGCMCTGLGMTQTSDTGLVLQVSTRDLSYIPKKHSTSASTMAESPAGYGWH
jgi:hypothetical protein